MKPAGIYVFGPTLSPLTMRTLSSHRLLRWLVGVSIVMSLLLVTGCGSDDTGSNESETSASSPSNVAYKIGSSLADTTLALVVTSDYGSDTLTATQFQRQMQIRSQQLSPKNRTPDTLRSIRRDLVQRFAEGHLIQGKLKSKEFAVDSAEVSREIQRLVKLNPRFNSMEQLERRLDSAGRTMASLRSQISRRIQDRELKRKMSESASEPTPSEVEQYSKDNPTPKVQHILIRARKSDPQSKIDSARQAAADLIEKAKSGTDFGKLARRHSADPGSAKNDGRLGPITEDKVVPPFWDAVSSLSESGDITPEPVRTRYGFHVIRLMEPGVPMDTSKARRALMQERRKQAYQTELQKMLSNATVQLNPDVVNAGLSEE